MLCRDLKAQDVEQYIVRLINTVRAGDKIMRNFSEQDIITILHSVQDVYAKEPIMLELELPTNGLIVVGDLHGDINSMLRILLTNGFPPQTNYLFLGNSESSFFDSFFTKIDGGFYFGGIRLFTSRNI
ncbi:unnamed protein product [Gongylonema pulchrum]|uniref:protein-serine/threonine phosphatase n=1 Tax=Gongylonema pulchrum TaxID=637853 RepID=A0A183D4J0_9BILA|nr:unnamed protein product [Gongylonema pulchrum]